jgi:hypothetical protein
MPTPSTTSTISTTPSTAALRRMAAGTGLPIEFDLDPVTNARTAERARPAIAARPALLFAVCLVGAIALQLWTGAYRVERGIYSDDAAHFMNGLVIRDYLTTALGQNPVTFAENYYLNYPKIAPLMWPPLFHVTLGLLLLLGGPPAVTALLLVAATAAWLVWRIYGLVRERAGPVAGVLAAALTITTPLVAALSGAVMLDVAIAAMALEAAYWLARYAQSSARRHAILFGVFTAGACLTKGNGVAVVLMPVAFIAITRRFDLLRKSGLYIAAAIVLVFAVPLLAVSARFDAAIGDFGPVTVALVIERCQFYGGNLWRQLGPAILALSCIGMVVAVDRGLRRRERQSLPLPEVLTSLVIAGVGFHLLSPHQVSVGRYLMMTIGPLIALAFFAAWAIADRLRLPSGRTIARIVTVSAVILATTAMRPAPRTGVTLGYRQAIGHLAARGELAGHRLLVVSDEVGEGAFVTEAAALGLSPAPTMVRGSKLLSLDTWMGTDPRLRYASPAALLDDLEAMQIAYVLIDFSDGARKLPYFSQLETLARTEPVRFAPELSLTAGATGPRRSLSLYKVTSAATGPAKPIQIDLTSTLGRTVSR